MRTPPRQMRSCCSLHRFTLSLGVATFVLFLGAQVARCNIFGDIANGIGNVVGGIGGAIGSIGGTIGNLLGSPFGGAVQGATGPAVDYAVSKFTQWRSRR